MSTRPCNCDPDVPDDVKPETFLDDPEVANPLPETEPFLIPLCLTRAQYQAIIDSLDYAQGLLSDNGCYEERTAVELLLAHLPYANKPLEIPCMSACDIISECIETNPGTQTAISNFMTEVMLNQPGFMERLIERVTEVTRIGEPLDEGLYGSNLEPDSVSETCQKDELYGAALGIVDYFDAAISDVFEKYEQASNTIEAAAIAAGMAPGVGSTAENAIEIADQIQENLAEAYAGEYDVEFRDALACDLFCYALAHDCHITLEGINDVLLTRLGHIDFDDLASLVVYVSTGAFTGDQIPEAAFLLVVNALRFGSTFAGILGLSPVAAIAKRAAEQDPSNAWEDLCLSCASYCKKVDLEAVDGDFESSPYLAGTSVYVPGSGWTDDGSGNQFVDIRRFLTGDVSSADTIRLYANIDPAAVTPGLVIALFNGGSLTHFTNTPVGSGDVMISANVAGVVWDELVFQIGTGAAVATGFITGYEVSGSGVAPDELSDLGDCP